MKTLQAQIPDQLWQEVSELAAGQNASVDQIVSVALTAQVSAWRSSKFISFRANRVNWQRVDEILARLPEAPPRPDDEL